MRFSSKRMLWLFFSSVLILKLTGFGCAADDSGLSLCDLDPVKGDFEKLSILSRSIQSIEDEEHRKNLFVISTEKWKHFHRKLEEERILESQAFGASGLAPTVKARLDALEKPHIGSQKIIDKAVLQCVELAEESSEELGEFLAFTPTVFEIFEKLGPIRISSDSSAHSCSLLYIGLSVREKRFLEFDPSNCDYILNYERSLILNPQDAAVEEKFLEKMAESEPYINDWLRSFEKKYREARDENFLALDELNALNKLIPADSILSLPIRGAKAIVTKFSGFDATYNRANQKFQALRALREFIEGLKEWVILQDMYFKEMGISRRESTV